MKKLLLILLVYLIFSPRVFAQWSEQVISPHPPKLNCVSAFSNYIAPFSEGWIGGDSGTILYTSNSGTNWYYKNNSVIGNNNVYIIQNIFGMMGNPSKTLCSANSSTATYIYRTTNRGTNWTIVYQQPNGRIRSIVMLDTMTGFAIGDPVGGRWTILKTTNGGINFDSSGLYLVQNASETSSYNSAYFAQSMYNSNTYLLFGTNNSRIYRSTNRGVNWSSVALPFQNVYTICLAYSWISFLPQARTCDNWGYACGNGADSTHSFGQFLSLISVPGTGDIHTSYCDLGYICYAKGSQIYGSTNYSSPFTLNYTSPNGGNYTQISLCFFGFEGFDRYGWGVKDNGTVSYYHQSGGGIKKISDNTPDKFSLSQNYPNPFNPNTKFKIQIAKLGIVRVAIFDILGKEVATLVNEQLKPGSYEVEWDGSNYPSGVYFYKLLTESFSETKKMVLVK